MTITRAKFRCNSLNLRTETRNARYVNDETGDVQTSYPGTDPAWHSESDIVVLPTVGLQAITPAEGWTDENRSFWEFTPAGSINITVQNPDAAEVFEIGKDYYVDFTLADGPA